VKPSGHHSAKVIETIQSPNSAVHSPIAASWFRSAIKHGLDPERTRIQELMRGADLTQERNKHGALLAVARPILDNVYRAVGQTGCCVVLTSCDGLILESRTSAGDADDFEKARLTPGANWSEQTEGTNGIGTCLVDDRAITIFREQHFYAKNIGMSCVDAPVRDHRGRLLGAIDVSTCNQEHSQAFLNLVSTIVVDAARKIECDFFRQAFPRARIVQAGTASDMSPALLAVDNDDLVIGATRAARRLFGLNDAIIANTLPATDILGARTAVQELLESERSALRRALARTEGNVTEAAKQLGIGRATFYRRMKRCGL
jgi:transcriptional regulator of acetoin/glycerol metabolism